MTRLRPAIRPCLRRYAGFALVLTVGVGCVIGSGIASAAGPEAIAIPAPRFPTAQVFTFLFLMLGPFKIIGPFSQITKDAGTALTCRTALLATFFAGVALLVAAFLGENLLNSFGIPVPVVALSAGIILFLVALLNILQQFTAHGAHDETASGHAPLPTLSVAMTPLAFPTIVTPYGIAAVVVFLALAQDLQRRLIIGAIVLAIMLLNLIVMIMTRRILPVLGVVLPILGAVLGVVQVALGLQIIHNSLRALGVV